MASTPEKKVKDAVKKILNSHEAYYFSPVTGGFGTSGVPDIVACIKGKFIGIETKAGKGKPTALQEKNLAEIMNRGGIAVLVDEGGIESFKALLDAELPKAGILFDLLTTKETK